MAAKLILFLVCFTICGNSLFASADCSVKMPSDLPKFEPVILYAESAKSNYALWKPNGQENALPTGSRLKLVCHGRKNTIESLGKTSAELTCKSNGKFATGNKEVSLSTLGCSAIPTSDLEDSKVACGDGTGTILEAGFKIESVHYKVFEICYNKEIEHTFWAHNVINGKTIKYSVTESTRRAFRSDGMSYKSTATNNIYQNKNQIEIFESLFGSSQPFISNTMFMARGHLAPDADFIFSYQQLSTYYYANCAPEFQVVNAGNWLRAESLTRTIAGKLNDDVDVYTGYLGVLTLSHGSKKNVPIYIDKKNLIEAPEKYWKIVLHRPTNSAVVFITENNPFLSKSEIKELCPDVCEKANVNHPNFKDPARGYSYCCDFNSFKKYVPDLPKDVSASRLLVA